MECDGVGSITGCLDISLQAPRGTPALSLAARRTPSIRAKNRKPRRGKSSRTADGRPGRPSQCAGALKEASLGLAEFTPGLRLAYHFLLRSRRLETCACAIVSASVVPRSRLKWRRGSLLGGARGPGGEGRRPPRARTMYQRSPKAALRVGARCSWRWDGSSSSSPFRLGQGESARCCHPARLRQRVSERAAGRAWPGIPSSSRERGGKGRGA